MEVATATEASAPAASGRPSWRSHPFPWLDASISEPYYFLHLVAFFSYFAARRPQLGALGRRRRRAPEPPPPPGDPGGAHIPGALRREVIYAVAQQPPYDGPGHSNHLTPLQLEGLLTEEPTTRFWLVEFRTSFSGTCIQASRVLPELSNIYSNKNISFGIVDLGHFPNAAAKFGISMWDHLPTYILFDKTTEVARFPEITSESKVFVPKVTKKLLCQRFDLDRRLIEYLSRCCAFN
ncbi:hypothetical protein ABZP36_015967 [Zizania latifolia]